MNIRTRFAPSPTGYLHIGGARTALFNYLYAKKHNGKFLLRIEDTDTNRSTPEAVNAIFNGLNWLNITSDEEPVFQMQRQDRHLEVAQELLDKKKAYKCYCTKEDLEERRKLAESNGLVYIYDGRCKNLQANEIPQNIAPAIRIDINKNGSTIINDLVMGTIEVQNSQIDDFIILRSDGTPTYMFAVVVDDYDMKISHIIRGDDHLTNAFRQTHIYKAMNWDIPYFAHLPLIHSSDGKKMSKRLGAVAVEDYKLMGFLPIAIRNYLLRLGWSHQNDEIISDENAIKWFDVIDINKSPARFDIAKLTSINSYYIKNTDNIELLNLLQPFIDRLIETKDRNINYLNYLQLGLTSIKERSKTLIELAENCLFYIVKHPFILDTEAKNIINNNKDILKVYSAEIKNCQIWDKKNLYSYTKEFSHIHNIVFNILSEIIRICLCGKTICPSSNFEIMEIIGKEETLIKFNQFL